MEGEADKANKAWRINSRMGDSVVETMAQV